MKVVYNLVNVVSSAVGCLAASFPPALAASNLPADALPAIVVETCGHPVSAKERIAVSITLISNNFTQVCRGEMSIRGSSSANREKRPYRLELQEENGGDRKFSLLDMPKESDWILYPAYTDKTMIRDVLAYELWRQMGYWAARTRYVHLFIHTNSSSLPSRASVEDSSQTLNFDGQEYQGLYVLMEKIKRGKHRVNIQKLPRSSSSSLPSRASVENDSAFEAFTASESSVPNDLSGGYIFKKDRHNNTNETHFRTTKKIDLLIEEPKLVISRPSSTVT